MDPVSRLHELGFSRVFILDGRECGISEPTLLLALMVYQSEDMPEGSGAWIHPYYFVSQQAYLAANQLAKEAEHEGYGLHLRDEIRVKPVFARMPMLSQGRNTISYLEGVGSRFHVQIFTLDEPLTPNVQLLPEAKPLHCGECHLCWEKCPTHALDEEGFHRDRCLRNWQMNGQPVPEALRPHMGNRLIGCDSCQRDCPHNPRPCGEAHRAVPLQEILCDPKAAAAVLRTQIGANLALPNRVLAQACLNAGCSGDRSLLPLLRKLCGHPSPTVQQHAGWAVEEL